MKTLTLEAPAKINLTLDILGRRTDGYHDMRMVMQAVSLGDTVTVAEATISAVRAPSFSTRILAENSLEPSGVIRLTILTSSTVPGMEVIRAGMDTSTFCPA